MKWVFPFTRGVTPRYYLPTRGLSVCPIRPILQPRHRDSTVVFLFFTAPFPGPCLDIRCPFWALS